MQLGRKRKTYPSCVKAALIHCNLRPVGNAFDIRLLRVRVT